MLLALLAEAAASSAAPPTLMTDPLGGWGSLFLQAGAFGLLVFVVVVLYPRQQKEAREERDKRDKETREERERRDCLFQEVLQVMQSRYDSTVKIMQEGFNDRSNNIVAAIKDQTVSLTTQMHDDHKESVELLKRVLDGQRPPPSFPGKRT